MSKKEVARSGNVRRRDRDDIKGYCITVNATEQIQRLRAASRSRVFITDAIFKQKPA